MIETQTNAYAHECYIALVDIYVMFQIHNKSFPTVFPRLTLNFKSQLQWTLIEHAAQHHTKPRHAQNYMHETQAHKHENNHHIAHVITNCAINTNFCPLSKLTATVVPTNQTTTPHSHTCQLLYRTNTIIRWALLQWQCMKENIVTPQTLRLIPCTHRNQHAPCRHW